MELLSIDKNTDVSKVIERASFFSGLDVDVKIYLYGITKLDIQPRSSKDTIRYRVMRTLSNIGNKANKIAAIENSGMFSESEIAWLKENGTPNLVADTYNEFRLTSEVNSYGHTASCR